MIDPADGDPVQQIQALTPGGLGVDVACECVGHAVTLNVALEAIRKGGTAAIVGVFEEPSSVHFNDLVLSERTLVGVLGYVDDSPCAIALLADGRINADPLITSRVALDDAIEDGFRELVRNKDEHVKILINPSGVGSKPSTPAALIARDEGTRGVRRRVGHEAGAAGRRLTGRPSSGDAGGCRGERSATIAATPSRYARQLRDDGRASPEPPLLRGPYCPIRPPGPLPSPETRIHHRLSLVVDRQTGSGQFRHPRQLLQLLLHRAAAAAVHGEWVRDLGTINVPTDSTLTSQCATCTATGMQILSDINADGNAIDVLQTATSGQSAISAGTYTNVHVNADGPFTITIQ